VSFDRRRSPRVSPERPLYARATGVDADLRLLDVSLGGFLVEGPVVFSSQETYCVRITAETGGRVFELHARAVYSRPKPKASPGTYETGFEFPDPRHPATETTVQALIDAVTFVPQVR
jgi:hypothetical protein